MSKPFLLAVGAFATFLLTASAAEAPQVEANRNRSALDAMQGKPTPALAVKDWINSKPLTMADLKGKIVVLDFWATWCGPCLAAVPHTNELMKKYADKGVVFIGVCAQNGGEKMAATVKEKGILYPVALDAEGLTGKTYMNDSFPDYYVIDRQGNLRWADVANKDVEKAVELLLKD